MSNDSRFEVPLYPGYSYRVVQEEYNTEPLWVFVVPEPRGRSGVRPSAVRNWRGSPVMSPRKRRPPGMGCLMVSEVTARARAAVGRFVDLAVFGFAACVLVVASMLGVDDLDR